MHRSMLSSARILTKRDFPVVPRTLGHRSDAIRGKLARGKLDLEKNLVKRARYWFRRISHAREWSQRARRREAWPRVTFCSRIPSAGVCFVVAETSAYDADVPSRSCTCPVCDPGRWMSRTGAQCRAIVPRTPPIWSRTSRDRLASLVSWNFDPPHLRTWREESPASGSSRATAFALRGKLIQNHSTARVTRWRTFRGNRLFELRHSRSDYN